MKNNGQFITKEEDKLLDKYIQAVIENKHPRKSPQDLKTVLDYLARKYHINGTKDEQLDDTAKEFVKKGRSTKPKNLDLSVQQTLHELEQSPEWKKREAQFRAEITRLDRL